MKFDAVCPMHRFKQQKNARDTVELDLGMCRRLLECRRESKSLKCHPQQYNVNVNESNRLFSIIFFIFFKYE